MAAPGDEARQGRIRLRSFYLRRLFRIQPAAFAYLAVVALLFVLGAIPSNWTFWWSAVLSFTNFLITAHTAPGAGAFLGHFWTLSVEEHFYILISLLFLFSRERRVTLLLAGFVLLFGLQIVFRHAGFFDPEVSPRRTYWTIQFLLFPALVALVVRRPRVRALAERFLPPWVALLALFLGAWVWLPFMSLHVFLDELRHPRLLVLLSASADAIFYGFALWTVAIMLHPRSWTTRFLELPALRFVGRLSYSIYLWHILFFIPVHLPEQIHAHWMLALANRPWKYIATFAAAVLSYYLIEKPMIRLGHRLAPPATAGHQDLNVPEIAASADPDLAAEAPLHASR